MPYGWEPVTGTTDTINPYVISTNTSSASTVVVITQDWSCTASVTGMDWGWPHGYDSWTEAGNSSTAITDWSFREYSREELAAIRRRERKLKRERRAATKRARGLLRRHLTKRQRADYDKTGSFYLQTPKGHRYKIGSARDHNVVRLNRRGKPMRTLCASIYTVWVPLPDVLLAQLLMLQHAEEEFLKIANQWAVRTARGFPAPAQIPRVARAA